MAIMTSIGLFVLAGLCEIGGGYLVWQWFREGKPLIFGILGGCLLISYGLVPTFQPAHFGRVYAAYGGMFVILSLFWGWAVDGICPDRFDWVGALICMGGVMIIMYSPRT